MNNQPPSGFYDDPNDPKKDRWWDGSSWTDVTRDAEAERPGPLDAGGFIEQLPGAIGGFYDRNKDGVQTAAGGALVADGLVGFGRNREGIGEALKGTAICLLVVIAGFIALRIIDATTVKEPVDVTATVVDMDRSTSRDSDGTRSTTCMPTLQFTTTQGDEIITKPAASGSFLCGLVEGDVREIVYDANDPTIIGGLDSTTDRILPYIPWLFILIGGFLFLSSLWTLILRATQIGAGLTIMAKARSKDAGHRETKMEKKATKNAKS